MEDTGYGYKTWSPLAGNTITADLAEPLGWPEPCRVLVDPTNDLFHESVSDNTLLEVLTVMDQRVTGTPVSAHERHIYQVFTVHAERMCEFMSRVTRKFGTCMGGPWKMAETGDAMLNPVPTLHGDGLREPAPNLQLGVIAKNQASANERIPWLLNTPAAVRLVKCELVGPVDLDVADNGETCLSPECWGECGWCATAATRGDMGCRNRGGDGSLHRVDGIVVAGQSGPEASPMHPDWVRLVRDECIESEVSFYFEGWGAWAPSEDCPESTGEERLVNYDDGVGPLLMEEFDGQSFAKMRCVGREIAGRVLDGRTWNQLPVQRWREG